MFKRLSLLFQCIVLLSANLASASDIFDLSKIPTIPIRKNIATCQVLLNPRADLMGDLKPDELGSVGIPISEGRPEEFKKALETIVSTGQSDYIRGSEVYVTGRTMGEEKAIKANFENILEEHGFLKNDVRVRVFTIPPKILHELSTKAAMSVLQNFKYLLYSHERDYQKPLSSEINFGLALTALVEVPNAYFLWSRLPHLDATLTLATHATMLWALTKYNKTLVNWLLRAPTSAKQIFLKQTALTSAFIANFNTFGKFSTIVHYFQNHGWDATLGQFPNEIANLGATQGFLAFEQTYFYSSVITSKINGWADGQSDPEKNADARVVSIFLKFIPTTIDAVALAFAAQNASPLFSLGPLDINWGHVTIAALTLAGNKIMIPKVLDPTLDWYADLKKWVISKKEGDVFPEDTFR